MKLSKWLEGTRALLTELERQADAAEVAAERATTEAKRLRAQVALVEDTLKACDVRPVDPRHLVARTQTLAQRLIAWAREHDWRIVTDDVARSWCDAGLYVDFPKAQQAARSTTAMLPGCRRTSLGVYEVYAVDGQAVRSLDEDRVAS